MTLLHSVCGPNGSVSYKSSFQLCSATQASAAKYILVPIKMRSSSVLRSQINLPVRTLCKINYPRREDKNVMENTTMQKAMVKTR
jgi:hypothetical protein